MDMHTKIKKELIRRFDENNWSKLTLHMKVSGDDVIIDPCHIFATEHTAETVQYFFIESPSIPQAGEETLNDLADFLAHYDENCKKAAHAKQVVQTYYIDHIQGKSVEMFKDGGVYFEEIMNQYDAANHKGSLDEFMQTADMTQFITDKHDKDYIHQAIELAHAAECYSDIYKSIYGHRPAIDEDKDGIL